MPDAKTLISNLLQFDPAERYDAHEALNHQFHSFTYQSIHSTLIKSYSRDPKLLQQLELFEVRLYLFKMSYRNNHSSKTLFNLTALS